MSSSIEIDRPSVDFAIAMPSFCGVSSRGGFIARVAEATQSSGKCESVGLGEFCISSRTRPPRYDLQTRFGGSMNGWL